MIKRTSTRVQVVFDRELLTHIDEVSRGTAVHRGHMVEMVVREFLVRFGGVGADRTMAGNTEAVLAVRALKARQS